MPRRRACLSAKGALIEHDHRQAFGRGIDCGGKPRRFRAHHDDVVDFFRVEFRRDAETTPRLGIGRTPQHRPVRAQHDRQLIGQHAEALDHGAPIGVVGSVEHRAGIAVAARKPCSRVRSGVPGTSTSTDPTPPSSSSPIRRRMNARIMILADLGRTDHQGAHMRRVERQRGAAFRAGAAGGKRLAPGELADLAGTDRHGGW